MRIIYEIDISGGGARISCAVQPGSTDSGGGPDISVSSDTGSGPDISVSSDTGSGPDISVSSDTGSGPDISVSSDTGSGDGEGGCCRTVIIGPTVILGCGQDSSGKPGGKSGQKIPVKRKVITAEDDPEGGPGGPNPGSGGDNALPQFRMTCQEEANWCWASVGAAVHGYMKAPEPVPQCEVVHRVSGIAGVCGNPSLYDKAESLKNVLGKIHRLRKPFVDAIADFGLIQREVDAGHPVAARIAWDPTRTYTEDRAHFVVIGGWRVDQGPKELLIFDPAGGSFYNSIDVVVDGSWVPYDGFVDSYRLTGRWVGTYLLRETR